MNSAEFTAPSAPAAPRDMPSDLRSLSEFLRLPLLCGNAPCRRTRSCRGDAEECIARRSPLVSEGAWAYVLGLAQLRQSGLPYEEEHWRFREEELAYKAWVRRVERACAPSHRGR